MSETTLPDRALVLLSRAGLDLNVLDAEMARIETSNETEEGAA